MFRVRFVQHTPGYRPETELDKVRKRLAALLKRQGLTLSHTDEAGFACYHQTAKRKRRTQAKRRIVARPVRPLKRMGCQWPIRDRWRGKAWYGSIMCPELATVFSGEFGGYCYRHGDKAVRREAYYASKQEATA